MRPVSKTGILETIIQSRFKRVKPLDQEAERGTAGQCDSGQNTGQRQSEQPDKKKRECKIDV